MLSLRKLLIVLSSTLLIHNANAQDNQSMDKNAPIRTPQEVQTEEKNFGVTDFLKLTFNHPLYARETLPCHMRDLLSLLNQGRTVSNPVPYSKALFKLFNNKIKRAPYLSAYGLLELLEQLPNSMDYLLALKSIEITPVHYYDELNNLLYDAFLTKFDELKTNPDTFFTSLTNNVIALVSQRLAQPALEITKKETLLDVQPIFVRFLDSALNKLMWNAKEPELIWAVTKGIASELESLYDKEFINDLSDLDDLYWTLIHRFSLFLDLAATSIPLEILHEMHNEVVSGNLVMLAIPEQEPYLEPKKQVLESALTNAISKSLAYEQGLVLS